MQPDDRLYLGWEVRRLGGQGIRATRQISRHGGIETTQAREDAQGSPTHPCLEQEVAARRMKVMRMRHKLLPELRVRSDMQSRWN